MKKIKLTALIVFSLIMVSQSVAAPITNERFALGAMSLCALNETLQQQESLDVYVLGNIDVAEELKIFLTQNVGFLKLNSIRYGDDLPKIKPDVLLVCNSSYCDVARKYCRDNKVFSISNNADACRQGLSTSIVSKVSTSLEHRYSMTSVYAMINKSALFAEGVEVYPQLLQIAKPVEDNKYDNEIVMVEIF